MIYNVDTILSLEKPSTYWFVNIYWKKLGHRLIEFGNRIVNTLSINDTERLKGYLFCQLSIHNYRNDIYFDNYQTFIPGTYRV